MKTIKEDVQTSADWISRALQSSGYRADFSPQSLWEVDRFFDEHSQNGAGRPGGLLSQDLGSRLFAIGSYIGEVLRRGVGGEWIGHDADPHAEMNAELHLSDGSRCWPMQRAMKRFKDGPRDGIAGWGSGAGLQVGPRPEPPKGFAKSSKFCGPQGRLKNLPNKRMQLAPRGRGAARGRVAGEDE